MNPYRNALIVGTRDELGASTLTAGRVNWISGRTPDGPFDAEVKIRYKAKPTPARITPLGDDRFCAEFDGPLRDITPGQGAAGKRSFQSSKPRKVAASSTDLRRETTALAGKLSSGQPIATQVWIT